MINFRFHLVSLIAVFLALAIGVVAGSTVIDRAIVDGLRSRIDDVERRADEQRRENGELSQRLERLGVYIDQSSPFAVEGRLVDVPVLVVAVAGSPEDVVESSVALLRQAGAQVPAILWLERAWALAEAEDSERLGLLLGVTDGGSDVLRSEGVRRVAERVAAGGAPPPSGEAALSGPPATDLVGDLVEAEFVRLDSAGADPPDLAAFPGEGVRAVVVGSPEDHVAADVLFVPVVRALADAGVPTVAAEVGRDDVHDAVAVGLVRDDGDLADRVSTVDALDLVGGRVALVLAVEEMHEGAGGRHYGLGPGASRQLPELSPS